MLTAKVLLSYLLQSADVAGLSIDTSKINFQEAYCLAENIYYEARSEDIRGQFAVASVTLNRAKDPRFPNTICNVVQASARSKTNNRLVCAFSWYCEKAKKGAEIPVKNKDGTVNQAIVDQFQVASIVALKVLSGSVPDTTKGSTHFHNPHTSSPSWRFQLKKTMTIGNHTFYRIP